MYLTNVVKSKLVVVASVILATIMLMLAVSAAFPSTSSAGTVQTTTITEEKRTMNVSGQGKITVAPDIAYVTLGVTTEDKDAKVAQQNNAKLMEDVVAKIKGAGVAEKDIQTIQYNISPKYSYDKDTYISSIIGYTVTNTVQITVRDISKAGDIIDIAADSGANTSSGIAFGLSDYDKYYNEALKKAVEVAKGKANTMASALGITLKVPVSVSESGGYYPPVIYNRTYDKVSMAAGEASTPIQAGDIEVTASVSMVYEY